jgi:hypothetical protein
MKIHSFIQTRQGIDLVYDSSAYMYRYSSAVMYRKAGVTTPVSYVWLDVMEGSKEKKSLMAELAQLENSGAIYRMTLPINDGNTSILVFEQPSTPDGETAWVSIEQGGKRGDEETGRRPHAGVERKLEHAQPPGQRGI